MVNLRHQVVCLSNTVKLYELRSEYMIPRLAVFVSSRISLTSTAEFKPNVHSNSHHCISWDKSIKQTICAKRPHVDVKLPNKQTSELQVSE